MTLFFFSVSGRSKFVSHFSTAKSVRVINISSLLAIKPIPGFSLYATGKAARDMFHAMLSAEVESNTVALDDIGLKAFLLSFIK